jgi:hypothetical protein
MRAQEEAQGIGGAVPSASSAAERILAEQAKLNVAAVELEKKRLEKMKLKQQKEIEQVRPPYPSSSPYGKAVQDQVP